MTARGFLAAALGASCAFSAAAMTKDGYLDLIAAAVSAYSDEHVARYLADVEKDGVQEHGFPRLAANLGVLVAAGRLPEKKEIVARCFSAACRDAAKGRMPPKSGGNEFSVKELALALEALETARVYPEAKTRTWRETLGKVEARRCYTCRPKFGDNRAYNWCVFGAASEQARLARGLGGDKTFVEGYVADQLRWFDANGMYRDPHQPAVYDLVTRLQFASILADGYDGPSRAALEAKMDAAAEPTLAMLSAAGEIPYGGRSNEFLHNHGFYAALCEWYAARLNRRGDRARASAFRAAADRACAALGEWLALHPIRHVKNRYPRASGIGCENYAYFDKYMVTLGSWLVYARLFADESIPAAEPPDAAAPRVFVTSADFHLVLASAGDYSMQFDYAADVHYDSDGLGRFQRRGVPAALGMSAPCAKKPGYTLPAANDAALACLPFVPGAAPGKKRDALVLVRTRNEPRTTNHEPRITTEWRAGALAWTVSLSPSGLVSTVEGAGPVGLTLPCFAFDGENETQIAASEKEVAVTYRGARLVWRVEEGRIVDTGRSAANRNGVYRRFEAHGTKRLVVRAVLETLAP